MTKKSGTKIRIVLTGGAGGQALQFMRLIKERDDLLVVGLIEGHNLGEARRRARQCDADQVNTNGGGTRRGVRQKRHAYPRCKVFRTVEDAISGVEFELALVCSRVEDHARETIALLRADKRVLCEKPPTGNLDEMIALAEAERESKGWFAWNFQLYWMWKPLRDHIQAGQLGRPFVNEAVWVRGAIAPSEQEREEESGVRRGQRGRPMVDLCHMLDAAIGLLPGARPLRVHGSSTSEEDPTTGRVSTYETLYATVHFPWEGRDALAELRVVCGFNIALHGEHALEEVRVTTQGSSGHGTVKLPVDERVRGVGPLADRMYWPQFTWLVTTGSGQELQDVAVKSPQPITVFECLGLTLDWVVGMVRSGEPHSGANHGIRVMQLLEAFERSVAAGEEVAVRQVD